MADMMYDREEIKEFKSTYKKLLKKAATLHVVGTILVPVGFITLVVLFAFYPSALSVLIPVIIICIGVVSAGFGEALQAKASDQWRNFYRERMISLDAETIASEGQCNDFTVKNNEIIYGASGSGKVRNFCNTEGAAQDADARYRKAIQELAENICEICRSDGDCNSGRNSVICHSAYLEAEHLYSKGYHKQVHGRWQYVNGDLGYNEVKCSVCGKTTVFGDEDDISLYCQHCGAKMDDKECES